MLRTYIISILLVLSLPSFAMLRMPHRMAPVLKAGCIMRRNYSQTFPTIGCEKCSHREYYCKLYLARSLDELKKCRDEINVGGHATEKYLHEAKRFAQCEKNLREIKQIIHNDDFLGTSLEIIIDKLYSKIKWLEEIEKDKRKQETLKHLREQI